MSDETRKEKALVVFQDKKIRRVWHNEEWWFSVVDIIEALTESDRARKYWSDLKTKLIEEGFELSAKIGQLKLISVDGKFYLTDCVNTKNAFRLIQSIPSKNAEPFKQWLAQVGYERIQEIENPELGQNRLKEYYKLKGYPQDWIDKRIRGIAIRQELTDEWKQRGIREEKDFGILTNEITKATFGKTVDEYKEFKGLTKKNQNLRDHMSDWELIFTMFGEKATTDITRVKDAQGLVENKQAAQRGGQIAYNARRELEEETKEAVVSPQNFLTLSEKKKLQQKVI